MPVPDYGDPRPAKVQIAGDLRAQIGAGKYQPGDKLPSVRELAERYGVVPGTIREAIGILRTDGVVETHSTRGTYVLTPKDPEPSPEFLHMEKLFRQLDERVAALERQVLGGDQDG